MSFILASASPRRKELLTQAGLNFETIVSQIDESLYPTEGTTSEEQTRILALEKATDVAKNHPDRLILGADTLVDCDGQIIGKPQDPPHAEQIIRLLFSRPHKVITAVALVRLADKTQIVDSATTTIYPKKLSEAQIIDHIKNGDWKGKAGAYGIQDKNDEFVEKIEGSYTNVIGLPMELVKEMLAKVNG